MFASVRKTCLEHQSRAASLLQAAASSSCQDADTDTETTDADVARVHLPKIVGIGLKAVFDIIRSVRQKKIVRTYFEGARSIAIKLDCNLTRLQSNSIAIKLNCNEITCNKTQLQSNQLQSNSNAIKTQLRSNSFAMKTQLQKGISCYQNSVKKAAIKLLHQNSICKL